MSETLPRSLEKVTRDWIQQILAHDGSTPTELARQGGFSQSILSRFVRGETRSLLNKTLMRISQVSSIEPPVELRPVLDEAESKAKEQGVNKRGVKPEELPVWGVIPVGRTGEFKLNPIPVATFDRPQHLSAGRRIAVFYAPDDSMAPRWQEGEPVVVDLARPAAPNTVALIRLSPATDPDDTETHIFRVYEGRRDGVVRVARLDGQKQPGIPIDRVLEVRRVLDWKDLLG